MLKCDIQKFFSGFGKFKDPYKLEWNVDAVAYVPTPAWNGASGAGLYGEYGRDLQSEAANTTVYLDGFSSKAQTPVRLCVDLTPLKKTGALWETKCLLGCRWDT